MGTIVTNQNHMPEEINEGLNSGNARYHSVQNFCPPVPCPEIQTVI
jgi:hypothetical protein